MIDSQTDRVGRHEPRLQLEVLQTPKAYVPIAESRHDVFLVWRESGINESVLLVVIQRSHFLPGVRIPDYHSVLAHAQTQFVDFSSH